MHYTFVGLSLALAAVFLATGSAKILRARWTVHAAQHLGYSARSFRVIGTLEVAATFGLLAGLAWTPLGTAAAVGLVALLIGAVLAHRRAGDAIPALIPPAWLALASAATAAVGIVQ
ncbi:DoxX family protein [Streptomyces sp. NBC_01012]|uniref:DoxX family protein n=1 Tax=Streptomyces sp. NBC_01012 TaxID=2903717 RepID=UPI00386F8B5C|nr:DoxX family protein [Streptomyces sp. NBC_01012]